ncbi:MAG: rod shape-determining protein [Candidatus Staskawiczbacteria bacterium RIFCSPHIGHO2_01_FULL_41_41]|uniref:Cell shape-determining protein MreB n=1 Tax=Candidatus Staskawiczbacteria bacterium RIFCSPHIGHO2_01_FULL_41_41 TaxID=1802203 RepID=A0A1G2HTM5_9BACT|nr:MAG: rod shape-determining protein [Candidatus Staskawiczbacteria bacterium RIFCSPHIGHO2_01_FULL_41_41]OGZ74678.1 MAG: rod shape-determining protein [Candidatus Staskawiczbacteria bacterium RIFCSPLOWO2_01_FULL_43_17b]
MFNTKIAIDLGTCNSLVYVQGKGIVLSEPSVVAVSLPDNRILAVGDAAKEMIGRTPADIKVYRPLKDGVIADYKVTQAMMKHFIAKAVPRFKMFKPELVISVPAGITSTERRAVIEAALSAGARSAFVAKEPILAAIGAGIPINSSSGHMIIDIGGGTSEVAVISLGGIVAAHSVRVAGDKIDAAITEYIKKKYNLAIGTQSAEEIKIKVGTALPQKELKFMEIQGRDLILGLPRNIKISNNEVCEAISDTLSEIIQAAKMVLSETPPELSADIMNKGIIMAGGGALLPKINELVAQSTGVPCFIAEEPLFCVIKGTGTVLEHLEEYKKVVMSKK